MTKFEMNYRKTDMRAFFNDVIKKNMVRNLLIMYSVIGIAIFAVFIAVNVFIDGELSLKPLPFIFLAVLIVIIFLSINRITRNTPEKMFKEFKSIYDGGTVTTIFINDRIYIESSAADDDGNGYILYKDLEKAVESDNYFYIFINEASAQIIKKSALVEGSIENVRDYLKSNLGSRYENITKDRRD